jgi:hypothetical protein
VVKTDFTSKNKALLADVNDLASICGAAEGGWFSRLTRAAMAFASKFLLTSPGPDARIEP